MWAAEYQHVSTVKFLLDIGADPNLKDQVIIILFKISTY